MGPVTIITVSSLGWGLFRQMPAIGRLLWGLKDLSCCYLVYLSLQPFSTPAPPKPLLSFPSSPRNRLDAVHGGCSLLRTSSTESLPQQQWGLGV